MSDVPRILVVSTRVDIATDYVIEKLSELRASFVRINTEDYPLRIESSYCIEANSAEPVWRWGNSSNQEFDLREIRSVWYRRHRLPQMPASLESAHAEYCLREAEWFLRGCVYSADCVSSVAWMSHPTRIQMAESKIHQLTVAKSIGLSVPDTLISNDATSVRGFFQRKKGKIVAKPLRLGYFDYGARQTSVYTNEVLWEHLKDDLALKIAPVIFQELIPKRFDIRVTIVDELLFSAAIHSQQIESARIDWRRTDDENLPHSRHDLPV